MSSPAPRRGDIWWMDFGEAGGKRPGVILTSDKLLPHLTNVTAVVVTTRIRGTETEVRLAPAAHKLHRESAVNCNNILTVPQANLVQFISRLDQETMNAIAEAIHVALDLEW